MHYERAALLGEYGAGMLDKNQREDRQIGGSVTLYLEGKTPLTRMIFPPRRQLHESRH
jgi:hypothetical protein